MFSIFMLGMKMNFKSSNYYYGKGVFSAGHFSASKFLLGIFIKTYLFQGDFIANRFSVTP